MASEFLQTYAPLANDIATRTGLDPAVVLGIIDTETGGGTHVLSNNIFGISPGGKGGQYVARYPDVQAGAEAFVTLMQQPRYAKVLQAPPEAQPQALVAAGYNTVNPKYAALVAGKAAAIGKELGYQDQKPAAPAAAPASPTDALITELNGKPAGPPAAGAPAAAPAANPTDDLIKELTTPRPGDKPVGGATPPSPPMPLVPPSDATAFDSAIAPSAPTMEGQGALGRIGQAALEGAQNNPLITPAGQEALSASGPLGRFIYNPLLTGAGALVGGFAGGAGQAAYEAGALVDPRLGRDLYMLNQVAPAAAMMPGGIRPGGGPVTPGTVARNTLQPWEDAKTPTRYSYDVEPFRTREGNIESFLLRQSPETLAEMAKTNPDVAAFVAERQGAAERQGLAEGAGTTAEGAGAAPVISAPDRQWMTGTQADVKEILDANKAAGVPGDLSAAATPEDLAKLTPSQMKAYRRQAELGQVLSPPGTPDTNIYVDGSVPTRGQYMADASESQAERSLREKSPDTYKAQDDTNRAAQIRSYENMMGTDIGVDDLRQAKTRAAERDGQAYLKASGPLDMQPALAWVDEKLADPRLQERPDVVNTLRELRASLFDADGNLKTDPNSGWGLHDKLMDDLEKAKERTSQQRFAKGQLVEFKGIIDKVNDDASGGAFRTFLDNQSRYAQQINAQTILQEYRSKLTNNKGEINAPAFHRFVTDLAKRRGRPGVDPAMDIPDETMRGLINLNEDLKRATNLDLGKARGSNTHMMFELAKGLGIAGAHAGAAVLSMGNPIANLAVHGGMKYLGNVGGNMMLRRRVARSFEEPPGGFNRNALADPNAPP